MVMIVAFMAQRVIAGRTEFEEMPPKLQALVAVELIDGGFADLVPVEFGGTRD